MQHAVFSGYVSVVTGLLEAVMSIVAGEAAAGPGAPTHRRRRCSARTRSPGKKRFYAVIIHTAIYPSRRGRQAVAWTRSDIRSFLATARDFVSCRSVSCPRAWSSSQYWVQIESCVEPGGMPLSGRCETLKEELRAEHFFPHFL